MADWKHSLIWRGCDHSTLTHLELRHLINPITSDQLKSFVVEVLIKMNSDQHVFSKQIISCLYAVKMYCEEIKDFMFILLSNLRQMSTEMFVYEAIRFSNETVPSDVSF